MPGQRSSATPTRSTHENERILRFQTLCRTLAHVAEWPTSISSRSAHVLRRYVFFHPAWEHAAFAHAKNCPFTFITDEDSHVSYEIKRIGSASLVKQRSTRTSGYHGLYRLRNVIASRQELDSQMRVNASPYARASPSNP